MIEKTTTKACLANSRTNLTPSHSHTTCALEQSSTIKFNQVYSTRKNGFQEISTQVLDPMYRVEYLSTCLRRAVLLGMNIYRLEMRDLGCKTGWVGRCSDLLERDECGWLGWGGNMGWRSDTRILCLSWEEEKENLTGVKREEVNITWYYRFLVCTCRELLSSLLVFVLPSSCSNLEI